VISKYALPGWKLGRIKFLPWAVVGWFLAFLACWPVAYCVYLLSRIGDQARVERTLHDLNQLADAMAKAYLAQRTENASGLGDAKVTMSVRQLIRTGIAPVSLMSPPSADQPLSLFNAWGGPIVNSMDSSNIRIDLVYVPSRVCPLFLQGAHSLKPGVRLTTEGQDYLKPPIDPVAASAACYNRTAIGFLFPLPDQGIVR
jgi:hypothetical protein